MRWLVLGLLVIALGCSADAAPEPEPTVETPGAFVAVQTDSGAFVLHRILNVLRLENGEELVFSTIYAPESPDFEAARELAREPRLPISHELSAVLLSALTERPWRVVWFRTLTDEELDVLR